MFNNREYARMLSMIWVLIPVSAPGCGVPSGGLGIAPFIGPVRIDWEELLKEVWPMEESTFFIEYGQSLEKELSHRPANIRMGQLCFVYPEASFPEQYPDGVWAVSVENQQLHDPRLLREAVGKEKRSEQPNTLLGAIVFARQRSEKVKSPIGELTATAETIHESNGKVEYRLLSIRVVGEYDAKAKKWRLVSKEIRPIGEEAGS